MFRFGMCVSVLSWLTNTLFMLQEVEKYKHYLKENILTNWLIFTFMLTWRIFKKLVDGCYFALEKKCMNNLQTLGPIVGGDWGYCEPEDFIKPWPMGRRDREISPHSSCHVQAIDCLDTSTNRSSKSSCGFLRSKHCKLVLGEALIDVHPRQGAP